MDRPERKETGTFTYKCKTKTGYSLNMTGKVFGPKHGNVVVAALDSQLADDVNLLSAAPQMLKALLDVQRLFAYRGEDAPDFAATVETAVETAIAEATPV